MSHHATKMPRMRRSGRGSRGRGGATPARVISAENPIGNPAFRAQLSRIILGEIERVTGRTLWNIDRNNVLTARVPRMRLILGPEAAAQGQLPHAQNVPPEPPCARVENEAENRVTLPDGHTDTRTQILNLIIILTVLNFVLNIYILHHLVMI